jgi:hypothetical protein
MDDSMSKLHELINFKKTMYGLRTTKQITFFNGRNTRENISNHLCLQHPIE